MSALLDCHVPPDDGYGGLWIGRVWRPGVGPSTVRVTDAGVFDITAHVPTSAALFETADPATFLTGLPLGERLCGVADLLRNSDPRAQDRAAPWLLAPIDFQAIKAAGVTFAASMLERVVEEQAKGDPAAAEGVRRNLSAEIGVDLASIRPGSPESEALKAALVKRNLWSQYLEVGLGPDAEVFTKAQPLSAVGYGADIGIHPKSAWNNPEPEIVVVVASSGHIVGATIGNDVNLRDFEGRSALLLSKAKDNNASTTIGPFIRLFDAGFGIDDIRQAEVAMRVLGEDDGFEMEGSSSLRLISRDPEDLVAQTINRSHQYPDGFVLFLGTMFAPTKQRGSGAGGFTHHVGDIVAISSARLGTLVNRVCHSDQAPPWEFGALALMSNLASRGLLAP